VASVRIVLARPRNPLNIGAAARAMANFGLTELALVAPYAVAWDTARSARAGAAVLRRAQVCRSLAEATADCALVVGTTDGAARTPALRLEDWPEVAASLPAGRTALVFGPEKTGLSVEDLSHCHRLARIPTRAGAPSMNLGQAVAVCAYEVQRGGAAARPRRAETAAGDWIGPPERERLLEAWYPLLQELGVVREGHRASQTRAMRAMLLRWRLTPADERRLLGLARQLRLTLAGRRGAE
jgi:TrmH family RNA methyltransferase